jgi:hypothetical protein
MKHFAHKNSPIHLLQFRVQQAEPQKRAKFIADSPCKSTKISNRPSLLPFIPAL